MPGRVFVVHGEVQGVGFRWWTRSLASRLGLTGTVRNREDGTVEVRATGDATALRQLAEELARGPSAARVERVDAADWTAPHVPDDFSIAR